MKYIFGMRRITYGCNYSKIDPGTLCYMQASINIWNVVAAISIISPPQLLKVLIQFGKTTVSPQQGCWYPTKFYLYCSQNDRNLIYIPSSSSKIIFLQVPVNFLVVSHREKYFSWGPVNTDLLSPTSCAGSTKHCPMG